MNKTYHGKRIEEGCEVYVTDEAGRSYPLSLHQGIRNHSPTGFNWGYQGSGAAQLALAILADHFGPDLPPSECPFCASPLNGWKCSHDLICGYDGLKEGDAWRSINGGTVHYQEFKRDVVARLQGDTWTLTSAQIQEWIDKQTGTPHS